MYLARENIERFIMQSTPNRHLLKTLARYVYEADRKKPDFRENGWPVCFDRIFGWTGSIDE